MGNAKACSSVAQCDVLVIHHAPRLRDDAAGITEGVAAALKAGESAGMDYSRHGEERRERGISKWRENSYVPTVQSERTLLTYFTKKHLRWFPVTLLDILWFLSPDAYGRHISYGTIQHPPLPVELEKYDIIFSTKQLVSRISAKQSQQTEILQ